MHPKALVSSVMQELILLLEQPLVLPVLRDRLVRVQVPQVVLNVLLVRMHLIQQLVLSAQSVIILLLEHPLVLLALQEKLQ